MGACSSSAHCDNLKHHSLGDLQVVQYNKHTCLKAVVYLKDEQDYLEWTKEIKKMKYNKEVKDYLLLPLGERFISETDLLCVMTPRLEVFFEQYREDLETVIERYKELKMDLSQSFLWYVLFCLVKCSKFFENKEGSLGDICPANILLTPSSNIMIICQQLIPKPEEKELRRQLMESVERKNAREVYLIGITMLTLSTSCDFRYFYTNERTLKEDIDERKIKAQLAQCSARNSSLLTQTITEMLEADISKRGKASQIYKRLEAFQTQIMNRKECIVMQTNKEQTNRFRDLQMQNQSISKTIQNASDVQMFRTSFLQEDSKVACSSRARIRHDEYSIL